MARILLTHSYFLRFDSKQLAGRKPYPPLATLLAASILREKGHEVFFSDSNFASSPSEIALLLKKRNPAYLVIYDDGFNYLTKMCLTNMREAAYEMIAHGKKSGCRVIVSGSDSTDHYEAYIKKGADCILLGEADETLPELLHELEMGIKDLSNVRGIAWKKGEEVIRNAKRNVIAHLDNLPFPAWDIVDIKPYQLFWKKHGYFSINIATTRGCPFRCNWCAKPIYGNFYNSRSPRNVLEEIKKIKTFFHFDHIWFCDDIFGLKPGWVQEFSEQVQNENLRFRFKIQSRADLLLKENTIEALARAGCEEVWIGAESGSQKILNAMDKGITVEQIRESTALLKKHGIRPCFFLQFGYPGETKEDIQKTMNMVMELMPYDIGVSVSYPLPGTTFYENVKADMKTKSNWSDSDDLGMMYSSPFHPSFYKTLHRYLHRQYRKKQGLLFIRNKLRMTGNGNEHVRQALLFPWFMLSSAWYKTKLGMLEKKHD